MLGKKNWLVILVSRTSMQIAGLGQPEIETINFPPSIINNMEIINKDELYTLVTNWLKQHSYISTSIIWLIASDLCFSHTLSATEQAQIDSETLQFLDTVPFEDVLSRVYKPLEWHELIAVNKELIMSLIQAFVLHGHETKTVVPCKLIKEETTLTKELEQTAIKHVSELIKESLIITPNLQPPKQRAVEPTSQPTTEKSKSTLPLLLGVFGVLLIVLISVVLITK